jgi:energy-coupling factor transporter ATP-binding protein EcfA2
MSFDLLDEIQDRRVLPGDDEIWQTTHADLKGRSSRFRMRWFYLLQLSHRELERVFSDLLELMEPDNDVKIISVIGMTGIGKTTLARELMPLLEGQYGVVGRPDQCPVLHVSAPANGEKSLSWRLLYRRILQAGEEPAIDHKRLSQVVDGKLEAVKGSGKSLGDLRELVEKMLLKRRVKALIVDEALHLLRFNDYSAIMDTLKSLADMGETKLLLIGTHQIAALMIEYGQVVRRSEIVHYRRYLIDPKGSKAASADEAEYCKQLQKFQDNWPCKQRPNLLAIWRTLMLGSLGSIGLTKSTLLRLLAQQLAEPQEQLREIFFRKAFKGKKSLRILEAEAVAGEEMLEGACYGDGYLSADEIRAVMGANSEASSG